MAGERDTHFLPLLLEMMMKKQSSNERSETSAAVAPFEPGTMHNGVLVVFMFAPDKKKKIFGVKKTTAVLKRP